MYDKVYRVKPLAWERDGCLWQAKSVGWSFEVDGHEVEFTWSWFLGDSDYNAYQPCDSIEDGKAKAEAFYRSRLESALEAVDVAALRG